MQILVLTLWSVLQGSPAKAVEVPNRKGPQLEILNGINGAFRPKVLTALMGVTGAGKTTLMDCLAGRKTTGLITGEIRVNGHPWEVHTFARVSGYVEQFDVHSPTATVREAVLFSAAMRFPAGINQDTIEAFTDEVSMRGDPHACGPWLQSAGPC